MNESATLEKYILQTIVYYDILNYPLTSFEIWKYLIAQKNYTLGEVIEALESKELKKQIEEFRGFYFLRGRRDLVERRIQNNKNSITKFKIAERVVCWLRFVPFVRLVAVTGTVAMKNCEKNSDIDFFVGLEKGRIFTGRLLVTAMIHLLGKRRYGKKIKNRICLNYFLATGDLEIERQDLFAANEYSFIYPLFDSLIIPAEAGIWDEQKDEKSFVSSGSYLRGEVTKRSIFFQFGQTNVGWIKKFKPNWEVPSLKPTQYFVEALPHQRMVQRGLENLINLLGGDKVESWQKQRQVARIERNPLSRTKGAYIKATDKNLIFLPVPQGRRIEREWRKRIDS